MHLNETIFITSLLGSLQTLPTLQSSCECVPPYLCFSNNGKHYGESSRKMAGIEGGRFEPTSDMQCANEHDICCMTKLTMKNNTSQAIWRGCGSRNVYGIDLQTTQNKEEADYGEFPWVIAIHYIDKQEKHYRCTGSLIHPQVVLTAAHCMDHKHQQHSVRAGEWDRSSDVEKYPHQDIDVDQIILHPSYSSETYIYDAALLILKKPFILSEDVNTVCLPAGSTVLINKQPLLGSGWGKDQFGPRGVYNPVLKKVQLPFIDSVRCEILLRDTLRDREFELDTSFICAGGEKGEDLCVGDGGAPLVAAMSKNPKKAASADNFYIQVGIMALGIECKRQNVPALYTNIQLIKPWIDDVMNSMKFDRIFYEKNLESFKFTPRQGFSNDLPEAV